MASNFDFLLTNFNDLAQLGKLAELCVYQPAGAAIHALGLLGERITLYIAAYEGLEDAMKLPQPDRVRALRMEGFLSTRIDDLLYALEVAKDRAIHAGTGDADEARLLLEVSHTLCRWFYRCYGDETVDIPVFALPENLTERKDFSDLVTAQQTAANQSVEGARWLMKLDPTQRASRIGRMKETARMLPLSEAELGHIEHKSIRMNVTVLPSINYALQQNGIAAISCITIENTTDAAIENVELTITATPAFALPFTRHIDHLPANRAVTVTKPNLILDGAYLAAMTEKLKGVLTVTLTSGETVLGKESVETTVLAYDQWHGYALYPELIVSFVTPNHPALAPIIARATKHLKAWTGDTAMSGYQTQDANYVLSQAAALFTAIKEEGLHYSNPPASFERFGQRIRLVDTVLAQKLGTCLDLTLLYAAALEAIGLHPLLILVEGHIFTGFWLEEKMFSETVQDDFSLITKRLASGVNEIAVVETTLVVNDKPASFDDARRVGERNLVHLSPQYIIDVRRARLSGVSPLPLRVKTEDGWVIKSEAKLEKGLLASPDRLGKTIVIDETVQDEIIPKKAQWERKLLDLGLRNTLLNLRMGKNALMLLTSSLDALEDTLADGNEYAILAKPPELKLGELRFETLPEYGTNDLVQGDFLNKRLRAVLTEGELQTALKELYRSAKTAQEENGANTLYLALGILRWFETPRSVKPRYAPIILVPIEMVRKSAAQGYVIRLRDEEPQINVTLLEKLKQDFGILIKGVDPLPVDEHGIDIRRVLTILRQGVMDRAHWDVVECACIGNFSFSQFVMWNDIRNRTEDLLKSKVVSSLMEGQLTWNAEPLEIGDRVDEDDVLLPMPADASQLYAIRAAVNGESFVLHGPPGTGKSQTITSLIANALAKGKRVLFVAEKMAALEVVEKRLERIGLGPFCLELHSNKSKKRDVLEQLRRASEVTKTTSAEAFSQRAEQLKTLRHELDAYAKELHTPLTCGSDLFTLMNQYERYRDSADIAPFAPDFVAKLTQADLDNHEQAIERMVAAMQEAGEPSTHPLRRVGAANYTQSTRAEIRKELPWYQQNLNEVREPLERLLSRLQLTLPTTHMETVFLASLLAHLRNLHDYPLSWGLEPNPQAYLDGIGRLAAQKLDLAQSKSKIVEYFHPDILELNGRELYARYMESAQKWFLAKMLGFKQLVKTLNAYAKTPVDTDALKTHIEALRDYQSKEMEAEKLYQTYGAGLSSLYQGEATDWEHVAALAKSARETVGMVEQHPDGNAILRRFSQNPIPRVEIKAVLDKLVNVLNANHVLSEILNPYPVETADWLKEEERFAAVLSDNLGLLRGRMHYVASADALRALGLGNVVSAVEETAGLSVMGSYKKAILTALIGQAIDASPALNGFSGAVFNEKIAQYQRMDAQWAELSKQEIYCRLAAKVPNFTREAAHSSELGILQRCIKSGGRGVSIRRLFDQIPNLLPKLCPCMLMSPISAAQYLDPKREPFDIVVFDEASQLQTCKAVGVLARGKASIVVGDPKQMPPTNFFSSNTVDEENLDIEDLESILDDCLALNMPQSHLLWHYRSRHESLITFSNTQFYENKLYTFPSVNDMESKVRLVHVDGVFERGNARTNKLEAETVVSEVYRRSQDPVLSKQSLGIVTFNISQQHLIDDLLTEVCAKDAAFEAWAYNAEEPLFVKNLENVQGDERDVILFSVGFGPDANGKVYMNFGPLNRDGGWRRLNVAVTRARAEMLVFSSLRSEQLDLNRTKAEGVAALRSFLEYAEGRSTALAEASSQKAEKHDDIARSLCAFLRENGYETRLAIGRSAYRVDIGVIDPKNPDSYLLGILLDGDSYGAAKTTRDRELAQISVLKGLGWNILRVWSMDWWDDRERTEQRVLKAIRTYEEQRSASPAAPEPVQAQATAPLLQAEPVQEGGTRLAGLPAPASTTEPVAKPVPVYQAAVLPETPISSELFLDPCYTADIRQRLMSVIKREGPISQSLLYRRVLSSYGISRAGSRMQEHLIGILCEMDVMITEQEGVIFFWTADAEPDNYVRYRVNGERESRRDVRDVPVQELAAAVYAVLYEQVSMSESDLLRETAKKLGYARLGGNVTAQLNLGLAYATRRGGIELGEGGNYVLTEAGHAWVTR